MRKHGLSIAERLERTKVLAGECWETTLKKTKNGYVCMKVAGKQVFVHRLAYETYIGPIPAGLSVCHHCDNRGCFNPAHLFAGTTLDNVRDMVQKGRLRGGSKSRFTEEQKASIATDPRTQQEIAAEYGTHQSYVSKLQRDQGVARTRHTQEGKARVGEAHGRALVTESDVLAIRASEETLAALAARYLISESAVGAIRTRRTWKHI